MRLRARDAVDPVRGPRGRCRSHRWPHGNEISGRQPILSVESHGEPVALVTRCRQWIHQVVAEGTSNERGAVYGDGDAREEGDGVDARILGDPGRALSVAGPPRRVGPPPIEERAADEGGFSRRRGELVG